MNPSQSFWIVLGRGRTKRFPAVTAKAAAAADGQFLIVDGDGQLDSDCFCFHYEVDLNRSSAAVRAQRTRQPQVCADAFGGDMPRSRPPPPDPPNMLPRWGVIARDVFRVATSVERSPAPRPFSPVRC